MSAQGKPKAKGREIPAWYKWELLLLLSLAFFFHQADRAIFGILLVPISESLGLSSEQMGLTGTILFATLALMMPIAGYVGDRFSKKWVITVCILFWSLATALTGLATGLLGLIFFRSIATAGGESFYAPSAYPMLAAYHHKTRSTAMSVHQAALYIGVMSSGFLAASIAEWLGWRGAFMIFGGAGILLGLIFVFRLRAMPEEPRDSATVRKDSAESRREPGGRVNLWHAVATIVKTPTFWFVTAGFTAIVFVNNAYLVWAPTFVQDKFHVSTMVAGGGAMFYHHIAAFVGILIGGRVTDSLVTRRANGRLMIQAVAMLLGVPALFALGHASSLTLVWVTMAIFGFLRGLYETNTHASLFDVIKPRYRSTAVALMTMIAFWFGSVSPLLMGRFRTIYGQADGLAYGFRLFSFSWLVGGILIVLAILFTFKRDRIVEEE
ncbi:MAG: MFS transporter [Planctomycetia bacterium]|nr:MFS transporter [Planctomycetia bacterium]